MDVELHARCTICGEPNAHSHGVAICLVCDGVPPILQQLLDHDHDETIDAQSRLVCTLCGAVRRGNAWTLGV